MKTGGHLVTNAQRLAFNSSELRQGLNALAADPEEIKSVSAKCKQTETRLWAGC